MGEFRFSIPRKTFIGSGIEDVVKGLEVGREVFSNALSPSLSFSSSGHCPSLITLRKLTYFLVLLALLCF